MTPKPGDYGLVKINGAAGRGITLGEFLNGDGGFHQIDHAFVYVGDQNQGLGPASATDRLSNIVEAEPGGARYGRYQEYDTVIWSQWDLADTQRDGIVAAAHTRIGIGYSAADYFAIAAHRLHLPLPGLRRYVESSGHQICSQQVDWCYQQAGIRLFDDDRWNGYVTPSELLDCRYGPVEKVR
jgi:hypothetical protein